jgi:hypothetical protein
MLFVWRVRPVRDMPTVAPAAYNSSSPFEYPRFTVPYSNVAVLVVIRATANVYHDASVLARPCVEWHAFAVVYVRFANVYHIRTAVWRPGAF